MPFEPDPHRSDELRVFRSTDSVVRDSVAAGRPAFVATYVQRGDGDVRLGLAHVPASRSGDDPVGPEPDASRVQAGQPGFWERHDAGDEVLVVLAGRATFTAATGRGLQTLDVSAGDVLHVPAGVGHSAEVHEALEVVFLLPSAGNTTWFE